MPKAQRKQQLQTKDRAIPVTRKRVIALVGGVVSNGRLTGLTDVVVDSGTNNYKISIDIESSHLLPLVSTTGVVCV